jgi:Bacterial regulatory proteins, luxR family
MEPAEGQTTACDSTPATTSDSVKHSTMVASTVATTNVVSPDTVRTHVSRAMVKLLARDRAQLVVFAIQSGLEAPPHAG